MADEKISALTAITGAAISDTDLFVVVDTSTNSTMKITRAELFEAIVSNYFASQVQAQAGADNTKVMTPLRVAEAIDSLSTPTTTQIFTASGTWTKPTGCKYIKVTVTGGGGGGGASNYEGKAAATGISFIDVTSLSSSTVTIGAGGAATNVSGATAGNNSVWSDGVNTITAIGAVTTALGVVATGADINLEAKEQYSFWGVGGTISTSPTDAINPGSGGGAHTSVSNFGGDGADGIIVVEEYY